MGLRRDCVRRDADASTRRALIVTRIFLPEPAAASLRLGAVASALADAGYLVEVLTATDAHGGQWDHPGVLVRRFPVLRDSEGYVKGYLQYLSFDLPLGFRLLAAGRADVVLVEPPPTTGVVARVACALTRSPMVYYAADVWSDAAEIMGASRPVVSALRFFEKTALSGARRVIAVSHGVADRVRALGARSVDVVRNGIDTSLFAPVAPGDPPPLDAPYIIYAGTASAWQGAGVFAAALRLLRDRRPDLRLVFLGQGDDLGAIESEASGDERVLFLGRVPPAEAARWQAHALAALVSIVPGRGYDFAYPTKVLAALACGTPVVYAGVGPVARDVADFDLGVACAPAPEAVADAIDEVVGRTWDRRRLRRWVEEHRSQAAAARSVVASLERAIVDSGR